MDKIKTSNYRVDSSVKLQDVSTYTMLGSTEEKLKERLRDTRDKLSRLQDRLYAHSKYSVLVCLQGMDTAGKDSLIREVFQDFNSRGVVVHSFKTPSVKEKQHDYLWRHYIALPDRGKFGVFNRTHYENVLVTRVHPEYILDENIPGIDRIEAIDEAFWESRFEQINNFEKHLVANGTLIFKFFLHISKEQQKDRLLRRLNREDKHWKFSPGDLKERALWDQYQDCYEKAINKTSTSKAPWFIIPSDNKKASRAIVADILYDELKTMEAIQYPELDPGIKSRLEYYKNQLENE